MHIIKVILGILGTIAFIPTFLLFPALMITAIIGAMKANWTYLKICLKIWLYSLVALIGIMILYAILSVASR